MVLPPTRSSEPRNSRMAHSVAPSNIRQRLTGCPAGWSLSRRVRPTPRGPNLADARQPMMVSKFCEKF
jgi:hypothetical protein